MYIWSIDHLEATEFDSSNLSSHGMLARDLFTGRGGVRTAPSALTHIGNLEISPVLDSTDTGFKAGRCGGGGGGLHMMKARRKGSRF